jgi:hypothetical protein
MPIIFRGPLPPDHPIFNGGVSFVFRAELPLEDDDEDDEDEALL